jgi:hypothetical protein
MRELPLGEVNRRAIDNDGIELRIRAAAWY